METTASKNTATLLQLSALTQYIFPLGNYIFPTLIWSLKKDESEFINYNGRQAVNFQLSLLLYSVALMIIAVPVFIYAIMSGMEFSIDTYGEWDMVEFSAGKITTLAIIGTVAVMVFCLMKIAEFFLIIYAAVKNSHGEPYRYPLTINFIK